MAVHVPVVDHLPVARQQCIVPVAELAIGLAEHGDPFLAGRKQCGPVLVLGRVQGLGGIPHRPHGERVPEPARPVLQPASDRPGLVHAVVGVYPVEIEGTEVQVQVGVSDECGQLLHALLEAGNVSSQQRRRALRSGGLIGFQLEFVRGRCPRAGWHRSGGRRSGLGGTRRGLDTCHHYEHDQAD